MKKKSHLYEGMYVLSATLSDEARKKTLDKIIEGIQQKGGEIKETFPLGRKRLAYDINQHREGFYYVLYFTLDTQAIESLWKEYHLNEDLIRFMTIRPETDEVPSKIEFKPLVIQS
jgi:small subunit ribosomal protein S6